MHSKRFRKLDESLCLQAVEKCFERKWQRDDILTFLEEFTGTAREDLLYEYVTGRREVRTEAAVSAAYYLQDLVEGILSGTYPEEMDPVKIRKKPDGATGKMRDIALLCIPHQLLNHVAVLMMEPLLKARLLPHQHASIPGRGQSTLKKQAFKMLHKDLGIKCHQKIDVIHAYASTQYRVCIDLVKRECPKATDLICLLEYLATLAPDGHLIIGGYLDAWLFNFVMSYAMSYAMTIAQNRRGKARRCLIRCISYMDDVGLFAANATAIKRAVRQLNAWTSKNLGFKVRTSTGIIYMMTEAQEKARKHEKGARHGRSIFDMGGFRMARTFITIRRRTFRRIRRQLLRAARELKKTGTIRVFRARVLISYYGIIHQTDSRRMVGKYSVENLLAVCRRVASFHGRKEHRERMDRINAQYERREHYYAAVCGC